MAKFPTAASRKIAKLSKTEVAPRATPTPIATIIIYTMPRLGLAQQSHVQKAPRRIPTGRKIKESNFRAKFAPSAVSWRGWIPKLSGRYRALFRNVSCLRESPYRDDRKRARTLGEALK